MICKKFGQLNFSKCSLRRKNVRSSQTNGQTDSWLSEQLARLNFGSGEIKKIIQIFNYLLLKYFYENYTFS